MPLLRLTVLLAAVGLATSRVGLIVHELGGHGGTAVAFGGEITDFKLFWFAGGWIRYDFSGPEHGALWVSLGGIIVEGVIGLALWLLLSRRDTLAVRLARGVGGALVIHAGWYFATGTWHGYGDGLLVHRALGDARYPIAIAAGLATCGMAFVTARLVLGALAASLPGTRRAKLAGLVVAALLAGGLQIGLALAEVAIRGDSTYGAIMRPERDRVIARELAAWQREQASRGTTITQAEREREQQRLTASHRELPFLPFLGAALVVAVAFGIARARPAVDPLTPRLVALATAIGAGSIVAVIAIDALFH
ncbi:MAG: hypothetical protein ABI867_14040 [Kofleriaceae bacterium]